MKTTFSQTLNRPRFLVHRRPAGQFLFPSEVGALLARLTDRLLTWSQRARDRRALQTLDMHLLQDIGLSRADVERESGKYFWQS